MSANHTLGIDLGRHRVYVVRSNPDATVVFPMQADHNGLIFRWLGSNGVERVIDHLRQLPSDKAQQVSKATCAMVVERIKAIDESAIADRTLLSIPVLPEVRVSEQLRSGFDDAGLHPSQNDLVQRPIASLANWLSQRRTNGSKGDHYVLTIDNDAGQISALVSDPSRQRLLAIAQLSANPSEVDKTADVALRTLLARASHVAQRFPTDLNAVEVLNAPREDLNIGNVVLSGTNTDHPELTKLIEKVAPKANVWGHDNDDNELVVASGLLRMHELDGWICPWPTGYLLLDNKIAASPGVLPLLTNKLPSLATEVRICISDQAIIRLSDSAGRARPTRLRGEDGVGLRLPDRLGNDITIRFGTDGKICFFGVPNAKPLIIQPSWPVVGTTSTATEVKVIRHNRSQQT